MVELIKHGLILNAALLDYLVKRPDMILRYEPTTDLTYAIAHSCAVKAEVVESDETDMGRREILNVGHTVGHALELACGYGRLRHGEAVALGLLAETTAANMVGLASDECLATLKECLSPLLKDVHLSDIDPATVCEALESDKKKRMAKSSFYFSELGLSDLESSLTAWCFKTRQGYASVVARRRAGGVSCVFYPACLSSTGPISTYWAGETPVYMAH